MKKCTLCKESKTISEFGKHSQKKDGLSSWCLICARAKASKSHSTLEYKQRKHEYDKKRYLDPVVKEKAYSRANEYYHENKEKIKKRVIDWQKNNIERTTSYKKNNKYKRRDIINRSGVTAKQLLLWEKLQLKICSYCGVDCSCNYQIDHIIPLSKYGKHELDNLTISCPKCNREKSDCSMIVWIAKKRLLINP